MGIFTRLWRWLRDMLFVRNADIGKDFGVKLIRSDDMEIGRASCRERV